MGIFHVLFKTSVSRRMRLQALANVFCAVLMWTLTLIGMYVGFFHIVPSCYSTKAVFWHRLAILYTFTGAIGNYLTCIVTKTDVKKIPTIKDSTSLQKDARTTAHGVKGSETVDADVQESIVPVCGRGRERFCLPCDMQVPIRSYHCYLCEKCIVKRDHHCFFMGVCIGRENHIYFICFTLFMGIGSFYGVLLLAKYLNFLYHIQFQGPQTFLVLFFNILIGFFRGQIPTSRFMGLFVLLYISLATMIVAFGFFVRHMMLVLKEQTTFEAKFGVTRYSKGGCYDNFRQVFNARSLVSLVLPLWDLATGTNYCRISRKFD
ncbi:palmitoyltransferase ZDHHC22-like [Mya arenaria]|uniref:palmitoyltransferase ZDHHC22-like n=1 Tax=Mya arenaria TaxID=6604 RepID=UPI0022E11300|nr:palmitoyltransferase ZDHHC22-like [Mya arenaria]XP_052811009.1 palmitoyltransferase ZDHHC22-like [Mya arenaria]